MTSAPLGAALTAGVVAEATRRLLDANPPGGRELWERRNFAGRTVSLTGGAAAALAVCAAGVAGAGRPGSGRRAAAAGALAAAAGGLSGLYDDLGEARQRRDGEDRPPKGLRGHLGALAQGRVTTGAAKILGIGAGALGASLLLHLDDDRQGAPRGAVRTAAEVVVSSVLVAGTANLLNLLDLRPGRALKASALLTAPAAALAAARPAAAPAAVPAAGVLATAAAAVPGDLGERTMLGDTGANALGAASGVALAVALPLPARTLASAAAVALTLASERVSFSAIIDATPALRALDRWGRLP